LGLRAEQRQRVVKHPLAHVIMRLCFHRSRPRRLAVALVCFWGLGIPLFAGLSRGDEENTGRWLMKEPVPLPAWADGMSFLATNDGPGASLRLAVLIRDSRWQTSTDLMRRDIGLGDRLFDFDNADDVQAMTVTALAMAMDPGAAQAKAAAARALAGRGSAP
jgi:hypothetical protein